MDNLYAAPVAALDAQHHFRDRMSDLMVVSPDVGGVAQARELATRIGAPLAIVDKRREKPGGIAGMTVIGDAPRQVLHHRRYLTPRGRCARPRRS